MSKAKTAGYPDHYTMKKARLKRLKKAHYTCEWPGCRDEAHIVHHIDGSIDNHSEDNFQALCQSHHLKIHGVLTRSRNEEISKGIEHFTVAMHKNGWSIRVLSREAGLSDVTVSKALRGICCTAKTYYRIGEALKQLEHEGESQNKKRQGITFGLASRNPSRLLIGIAEKGWGELKLAKATKIACTTVHRALRGESTLKTYLKLCWALEILPEVDDLS